MEENKNSVYLTKAGYEKLEERLEELVVKKRSEVAEKIKVAREFGDISENAEYDAAKEEQAMLEGEIKTIQAQLANAVIIDEESIDTNTVSLGCTVKLYDIEFDEANEYQLVGATEANIKEGKISTDSPVGAAILGQRKGSTVTVETPQGTIKVKIMSIS